MELPGLMNGLLTAAYSQREYEAIARGLSGKRSESLRVNTLKAGVDETVAAIKKQGFEVDPVSWSGCVFSLIGGEGIRSTEEYLSGRIYLQSLSSIMPAYVIEPKDGESILDMCAAPGGKTTAMAALCPGALITACEKNKIRAERLKFNLKKLGAERVGVMVCDARKLDERMKFDKILLDAPCTGSGTYLGDFSAFSEELYRRSVRTQRELIKKALGLLKPGGELVYSTCSLFDEENGGAVRAAEKMGAATVPIPESAFEGAPRLRGSVPGTLTVCPDGKYEGFFVARMRKP